MKKMVIAFGIFAIVSVDCNAAAFTQTVDGIPWMCQGVWDGSSYAEIWNYNSWCSAAIPTSTMGAVVVPDALGGMPVKSIGQFAFSMERRLTILETVATCIV